MTDPTSPSSLSDDAASATEPRERVRNPETTSRRALIDDDDAGRFVLGHRRALDGFRGVAVILVLLVHFEFIWPQVGLRWFPGGFIGVDLFFALSGFLLTSLLLQERRERGRFSFGAFYRRRAYRLLPALFFVMGCNIIYVQIVGLSLRPQLVANLYMVSYVANWALVFSGPFALTFGVGPRVEPLGRGAVLPGVLPAAGPGAATHPVAAPDHVGAGHRDRLRRSVAGAGVRAHLGRSIRHGLRAHRHPGRRPARRPSRRARTSPRAARSAAASGCLRSPERPT